MELDDDEAYAKLNEVAEAFGALDDYGAFDRGIAYWRKGKVLDVQREQDGRSFTSEVLGSSDNRYIQSVAVVYDRHGRVRRITGSCSCPVGFDCKHVVAAAFAWGQMPKRSAGSKPKSAPEIPGSLNTWLKSLESQASKKPQSAKGNQLFFVLDRNPARKPTISQWMARILKNGSIGKNARPYQRYGMQDIPIDLSDVSILGRLDHLTHGWGDTHSFDWPTGKPMQSLLREIVDTGRARAFHLDSPALVWSAPRKGRLEWEVVEGGTQVLRCFDETGAQLDAFAFDPPLWFDAESGECGRLDTELPSAVAAQFLTAPEIPAAATAAMTKALSKTGIANAPVPQTVETRIQKDAVLTPILRLSAPMARFAPKQWHNYRFDESDSANDRPLPRMRPLFDYGGKRGSVSGSADPEGYEDGVLTVIRRNPDAEAAAMKLLNKICGNDNWSLADAVEDRHVAVEDAHADDRVFLPLSQPYEQYALDDIILDFVANEIPDLERAGWRIEYAQDWPYRLYEGEATFEAGVESSGTDWFSFALTVQADGESIDLLPIVLQIVDSIPAHAYLEEQTLDVEEFLEGMTLYPSLADGRRVPIAGERLAPIVRALIETYGINGFHRGEAGRIKALADALEGCGIPWQGGTELLALGAKLRALHDAPEVEPPPSLKADLRPYQKTGFGWLNALSETGFGGVLADDMGLGKTVQALALLVQRHLEKGSDRPSLVVVPTSLIGNWEREAAKFAPGLKMLTLHGPGRKALFKDIPDHHVTLTTYPLVHRDHEALFAQGWDTVLLDEAQAIKNPKSSIAKRIREVEARHRVALTGTPMENSLIELWALFDWLVPGLLGTRAGFVKGFRTPIEKHGDREKQIYLSARISPFLLRRTKEVVAADLPAKTEIDEVIPLEGAQRDLYETLRIAMSKRVRDAIKSKGVAGSHITILDALLKLRQSCCDPRLVKLKAAEKVEDSAKRARLLALLDELVAEGRKVLIFSQFVEMLKLIETDIVARGWDYAMLTGRTKNRTAQVEKFQDGDASVFLISLKAGGVGLNLTAADTVILYDPWWNPAVERQAMDRAHRIGQDKPVFVYKMIAEGTVEQAIQTMQAKKQALADALFEGREGVSAVLDESQVLDLFGPA